MDPGQLDSHSGRPAGTPPFDWSHWTLLPHPTSTDITRELSPCPFAGVVSLPPQRGLPRVTRLYRGGFSSARHTGSYSSTVYVCDTPTAVKITFPAVESKVPISGNSVWEQTSFFLILRAQVPPSHHITSMQTGILPCRKTKKQNRKPKYREKKNTLPTSLG